MQVLDDALPAEALGHIASATWRGRFTYGWHSHIHLGYAHWNCEIVRAGRRNIAPIAIPDPFGALWDVVASYLPAGAYPIRLYANQHTYGVEGYPHTDAERANETTAVLYLNPTWRREWGGETTFYDGDEITWAVMPRYGRIAIFPADVWHCARSVSRICPVARLTLVLKARHPFDDADLMALDAFLQSVGAHQKPHRDGSLRDHLVRVYDLLKARGADRATALAGGLHSVYGTNAFHDACLAEADRQRVQAAFGEEAEALAWAFGHADRPQALLALPVGHPLQYIEAANLLDQDELQRWPALAALWRG